MKLPSLQHAGRVEVTALSRCGNYLFVSTAEQGWLLSWPQGALQRTIKVGPIFDAVFKEDGMLALCGARTVTMVGLPHLEQRPSAKKVSGRAVPGAVWLHGDRLVTASLEPGRALLLDFMGNRLATLSAEGDHVWSVATDDRYIAVYSEFLTIWDDTTLKPIGTQRGHDVHTGRLAAHRYHHSGKPVRTSAPSVFGLAFTPSGDTLISAGADGRVLVWDARTVRQRAEIEEWELDPRRVVATSETTAYLTARSGLYRVDLEGERIDRLVPLSPRNYRWNTPIGLTLSADRRRLVFGGLVGEVGVWDLVEDQRVR